MKKFEWVDHPADVGFRAYGTNLEEAFENAALALSEIMADTEKVKSEMDFSIDIEAEDLEALLFDWLDHFLYLMDTERFISSRFEVKNIRSEDEGFSLSGRAWGEKYDSNRHGPGSGVKAITYHMMEIEETEDGYVVQVVVDV